MASFTTELPPSSVNNELIVSPLILNTKWDYSNEECKLLVLVQWKGLFPDDTLWESWETFKIDYHLEDKVLFEEHGNVMKGTKQSQPET